MRHKLTLIKFLIVSTIHINNGYNCISQIKNEEKKLKLAEYMVAKGLRQSDLARKLNVSQVTVHNWVNGKRPPSGLHMMQIYSISKGKVNLKDWAELFDV